MSETPDSLFEGNERFEYVEWIGRGALGEVYAALDRELQTLVALKAIRGLGPDDLHDLKTEFRTMAGILHPNVVQLHELFATEDACYFTMEYVEGVDFLKAVAHGEPGELLIRRFRTYALQLLDGVGALHESGRVHRDIKPSNILVDRDGRTVIIDFDLMQRQRTHPSVATSDRGVVGTLAYMCPQQMRTGIADVRSDMYSIGAVFFEALSGALPSVDSRLSRDASWRGPIRAALEEVPGPIANLVVDLLDPDPDGRPSLDTARAVLSEGGPGRRLALDPTIPAFVGRVEETKRVLTAIESGASVVAVSGPSGIGKTELVRHVLRSLPDSDLVLEGRCHASEAVAYNALDQLVDGLSRYLVGLDEAERAGLVDEAVADAGDLFPVLRRVPGMQVSDRRDGADPLEARRRAVEALRRLFVRLGRARQLLLWIDDLQWADHDSVQLIEGLVRPPEPAPIRLIVSYRSGDSGELPELLSRLYEMRREHVSLRLEELVLGAMSAEDARTLASNLLPGPIRDADTLDRIVEEAAGHPFMINTCAVHLAHTGERPAAGVQLRAAFGAQIASLDRDELELLELISTCGRPAPRDVLFRASAVGGRGRPILSRLESRCLARAQPSEQGVQVDSYHDRIREFVGAQLVDVDRRRLHATLAEAFEYEGGEPATIARHHRDAGNLPGASVFAERAGAQAEATLAFAQAAAYFASARQWGDAADRVRSVELHSREAEALRNAGKLASSGERYLEVAEYHTGNGRLENRSHAAELLLAGGRFDRGRELLAELLPELGLRYPASPRSAVLGAVWQLLGSLVPRWWPGARPSEATPLDLIRVDTCYGAGRKLVDVDSARGAYFSALALRLSRRQRDRSRWTRSLCMAGGAVGALGGAPLSSLGDRLMARAQAYADEAESEELRGIVDIAYAEVHMLQGDWRDCVARSREGVARLSAIPGNAFECAVGTRPALRALEEMGAIEELYESSRSMMSSAGAVDDLLAQIAASQHLAKALIAKDDTTAAREHCRIGIDRLTRSDFHMQHLYADYGELQCDLYEGEIDAAREKLSSIDERLLGSAFLRIPLIRIDHTWLRARVALSVAATDRGRRASELVTASEAARKLERERRLDARIRAALVRAGIASFGATRGAAVLARAAQGLATSGDASVLAGCAALRGARWADDSAAEGDALAALVACGIAAPDRYVSLYMPGRESVR